MATKPAPRVTIDLSKVIPYLMARFHIYYYKSDYNFFSFNYTELKNILESHKVTFDNEELIRSVKDALNRKDIDITTRETDKSGKHTEFCLKLTKEFITKWAEPGH